VLLFRFLAIIITFIILTLVVVLLGRIVLVFVIYRPAAFLFLRPRV
jgi:hypothetical protein